MVNKDVAHNVLGIMGNVISFGLFASPIPTFVKIWKWKSVGEFKSDPYLATMLNCLLWIFYGLPMVNPGSTFVITINTIGLTLELIYLTVFFIYAQRKGQVKIIGLVLMEVALMAILVTVALNYYDNHEQRSRAVGILCVVFNVLMYASPLTVMRRVITTKSVKYMPFCLALTTFVNAIIWILYALIKFDLFILISNSFGLVCGTIQLILYAFYYKSTPILKPADLPLSTLDVQKT